MFEIIVRPKSDWIVFSGVPDRELFKRQSERLKFKLKIIEELLSKDN